MADLTNDDFEQIEIDLAEAEARVEALEKALENLLAELDDEFGPVSEYKRDRVDEARKAGRKLLEGK